MKWGGIVNLVTGTGGSTFGLTTPVSVFNDFVIRAPDDLSGLKLKYGATAHDPIGGGLLEWNMPEKIIIIFDEKLKDHKLVDHKRTTFFVFNIMY